MNPQNSHDQLQVTVILDGVPTPKEFRANEKVEEVMKSLLPAGKKDQWNSYQLVDRRLGTQPLNPAGTLASEGVQTGDTLAFTKKDGGGGRAL